MPIPDRHKVLTQILYKGTPCVITSVHGQPSSAYQTKHKFYAPGTYYNLREEKSGKQHIDIHHSNVTLMQPEVEHDRDRLVAERAD